MSEIKRETQGDKKRFAIYEEGEFAGELIYRMEGDLLVAEHTEVGKEFGGKGLAKKLVEAMVEYARENDYKVKAECQYVLARFKRDNSLRDVMA